MKFEYLNRIVTIKVMIVSKYVFSNGLGMLDKNEGGKCIVNSFQYLIQHMLAHKNSSL